LLTSRIIWNHDFDRDLGCRIRLDRERFSFAVWFNNNRKRLVRFACMLPCFRAEHQFLCWQYREAKWLKPAEENAYESVRSCKPRLC
jgi:endonuclease I